MPVFLAIRLLLDVLSLIGICLITNRKDFYDTGFPYPAHTKTLQAHHSSKASKPKTVQPLNRKTIILPVPKVGTGYQWCTSYAKADRIEAA